ncbi:hypothetical protein FB45DRAFT_825888 [Roridomyces roridus]|uniref:DUF2470 domain-containing protein n=1 Tax=Roridomyces roridus TaxID=1738132 RepID=A0AAD7FT10_9AGAR|nr:hypothetical protein FB45DRAFT_825888 [Roridomyces roridus]
MSDPVAEKSTFLKMYMSNHPDTLVAYAKWYGKEQLEGEVVTGAEMSGIDCKSMTLTCTLKNGGKKDVRVVIDPPLGGYEDVKPRLLEMKAIAQEGLGMIKSPILTEVDFPWTKVLTTTFLPVCALFYCTYAPLDASAGSAVFAPARFLSPYIRAGPVSILLASWWVLIVMHLLEAVYVGTVARKHAGSFGVGATYVLGTLGFGFPVLVEMRKRIQDKRIESVMKIE